MEAVGSNGPSAWLPGAAIGAGFGYASANIVGAMMTAAGLALAFVTLRLDAPERRHISSPHNASHYRNARENPMSATLPLAGQNILIIGGARDIGFAIANAIHEAGATPVIGARDLVKAREAAERIPGARAVSIDITDEDSIVRALDEVGPLDHIVTTASAHHNVPVSQLDHDHVVSAFEAKVIGPMLLAKHAAKTVRPDGSLLLFSGVAAWNPSPGYAVMGITNGAVTYAVTHLAKELAPIRVNAISPGIIDSGSWDAMGDNAKHEFLEDSGRATLVGRVGRNDDITRAALWLLEGSFVTGETIHVDGGARIA